MEIVRAVNPLARFYPPAHQVGMQEFFKCQTVVLEETAQGQRRGGDNAKPTRYFSANAVLAEQEHTRGSSQRKPAANKLPKVQAKGNDFLVGCNVFGDFDFDTITSSHDS